MPIILNLLLCKNMKRVNCDIMSTQNICVEAWIKFTAQKLSQNYHSTEIWRNPFFQKSVQTADLHWKLHWMYFSIQNFMIFCSWNLYLLNRLKYQLVYLIIVIITEFKSFYHSDHHNFIQYILNFNTNGKIGRAFLFKPFSQVPGILPGLCIMYCKWSMKFYLQNLILFQCAQTYVPDIQLPLPSGEEGGLPLSPSHPFTFSPYFSLIHFYFFLKPLIQPDFWIFISSSQ